MKSIEEIAREHGLILPKTNLTLCASSLDNLQAFAEAYHQAKLDELEPVAWKVKNYTDIYTSNKESILLNPTK